MNYDAIVIGGGPAGLSAAVQLRKRNKSVLVLCTEIADSALARAARVENYLGLPEMSGKALLERFMAHADSLGVAYKKGRVLQILPQNGSFWVGVGSDMEQGDAIVLTTGVQHGDKIPGERALLGAGVSYCATCDGMLYRGKDVVVVGESAEAPEEANFLHELGCNVTYIARARPAQLHAEIAFMAGTRKQLRILGEGQVTGLQVAETVLPCAGVFLLTAAIAPADLIAGLTMQDGLVSVDRDMQTSVPGVFAAGDCTAPLHQVAKAVGDGLAAGQKAAEYLDRKAQHA
ncbi:MAG: NAD(P)/FAD-dependent oxidoreductase [Oscillospiraceae bacterium]|nr:NAD(P)/FAD-dependent oxidoreductase [Oscillospiraceae bacterium]